VIFPIANVSGFVAEGPKPALQLNLHVIHLAIFRDRLTG
jgi:hypothetical protein